MKKPHALYRAFDRSGALLYIGITLTLSGRMGQHRDDKPWWTDVVRLDVEHHPDRRSALEAERAAIQAERPKHNVVHNTERDRASVSATLSNRFGIEVGFVVALMTQGLPTVTTCYVGEVQAVDDWGVRITLFKWQIGSFVGEDLFVRWENITAATVWTEEHHFDWDALAKWQNLAHRKESA